MVLVERVQSYVLVKLLHFSLSLGPSICARGKSFDSTDLTVEIGRRLFIALYRVASTILHARRATCFAATRFLSMLHVRLL